MRLRDILILAGIVIAAVILIPIIFKIIWLAAILAICAVVTLAMGIGIYRLYKYMNNKLDK